MVWLRLIDYRVVRAAFGADDDSLIVEPAGASNKMNTSYAYPWIPRVQTLRLENRTKSETERITFEKR